MKRMAVAVIVCATPTQAPLAAQTLSGVERRIAAEVDARAAEAIERAVNSNSGSMNFDGVREWGCSSAKNSMPWASRPSGSTAHPGIAPATWSLAAPGRGPRLLLIGHLDTVFEPSSPFQTFERDGDRAQSPGVVDMKGGDVVIVHALKALAASGEPDEMSVTIVMTGDDERSGRPLDLARAALIRAAEQADIVLAFENGDSDPTTAVIARRGSTGWRLDVTPARLHTPHSSSSKKSARAGRTRPPVF